MTRSPFREPAAAGAGGYVLAVAGLLVYSALLQSVSPPQLTVQVPSLVTNSSARSGAPRPALAALACAYTSASNDGTGLQ